MKKSLSIILAVSLVLGSGVPVYATKAPAKPVVKTSVKAPVTKAGIIKDFTEKSVTLLEGGKVNTYSINNKTKVINLGSSANIMDAAKKGLKVKFTANGKIATFIDIDAIGMEGIGVLGLAAVESRVNVTDSSTALDPKKTADVSSYIEKTGLMNAKKTNVEKKQDVKSTTFYYHEKNAILLGQAMVLPETIKVKVKGKELKLVDEKKEFDPTDKSDEFKLEKIVEENAEVTVIRFESDLLDDKDKSKEQIEEELEKIVEVSYTKREHNITVNELSSLPIHEEVLVELNGKMTTLNKGLYRGNYFSFNCNTNGEIVYIDAMYKDLECKLVSYDAKTKLLKIKGYRFGIPAFDDTVKVSDALVVNAANGSQTSIQNALKASKVKIAVDSALGYDVVSIQIIK